MLLIIKSQVKGYTRTRKGKLERVKPYSNVKAFHHEEETIIQKIEKSIGELLTWIQSHKKKKGILTQEQKKYVHKRLKEVEAEMKRNRKIKFGKIVQAHLMEIRKELESPRGGTNIALDLKLMKRGFTKQQLSKLSNREKDTIFWNEIKPEEI